MSLTEAIQALLQDTQLTDLCSPKQDVVILEHNMSIGQALKTLARKKVLSAPLVVSYGIEDIDMDANCSPQLIGWVDVKDILAAFLRDLKDKYQPLPTKMLQLMTILEHEGPIFTQKMLVTISGGADRGLIYHVNNNNHLLQAMQDVFLRPSEDGNRVVHRIAVFDGYGAVTNIVSQTDIVKFLHARVDLLGDVANQSIQDLGWLTGKPPLISVSPHVPTLLAYSRILDQGVSGAAVVADNGQLIANLSVSDLRCIQADHFGVLALPVGEFLAVLHGTVYVGYDVRNSSAISHPFFASSCPASPMCARTGNGSPFHLGDEPGAGVPLIVCTKDTTFKQLLELVVTHHVHRVYVVDSPELLHPQAVISLTDILRMTAGVW